MKYKSRGIVWLVFVFLGLGTLYSIQGQESGLGIFHSVASTSMIRNFPVMVYLPKGYGKLIKEHDVLYHLHGTNDNSVDEKGLRKMVRETDSSLALAATLYQIIIVVPLMGNIYFMDSPVNSEVKGATFISKDLVTFIDRTYKTKKRRESRYLSGFSMGGYGAVSLLCRYPDVFSIAATRGGVMDLAFSIHDLYWDNPGKPLETLLGSYWTNQKEYHLNGCFNLVNHIRERNDVGIVIEVGREDFLYKTNKRFNDKLDEINMPHVYSEYPGGHEWTKEIIFTTLANIYSLKGVLVKK